MYFSESDIWWLLSYKKSVFPDTKVFFYSLDISEEMQLMCKCYNIVLPNDIEFDRSNKDMLYINYYTAICDKIGKSLRG